MACRNLCIIWVGRFDCAKLLRSWHIAVIDLMIARASWPASDAFGSTN